MRQKVARVINKYARLTKQRHKQVKKTWRRLSHKQKGRYRAYMERQIRLRSK